METYIAIAAYSNYSIVLRRAKEGVLLNEDF